MFNQNSIPWERGRSPPQLMVVVWRRMYAFHESDPASRPPPVVFSPPKAPPISAPEVPMLTLAIPQSEPKWERKVSACRIDSVNIADERPWARRSGLLSPLRSRRRRSHRGWERTSPLGRWERLPDTDDGRLDEEPGRSTRFPPVMISPPGRGRHRAPSSSRPPPPG